MSETFEITGPGLYMHRDGRLVTIKENLVKLPGFEQYAWVATIYPKSDELPFFT